MPRIVFIDADGGRREIEAAPGQSLRVAVLETPAGNLFFQLWGDRAAVAGQEAAFRRMVQNLRRAP